jgi:hypothetical protein
MVAMKKSILGGVVLIDAVLAAEQSGRDGGL